ncbi:Uncharacterised protein [Halioglobus japonicus]|nr:Uncharacterised protein [Halioglobus japonicus]
MRYWIPILSLLVAPLVSGAHLDDVLSKVQGTTGGEEDFMAGVTWSASPEQAYYSCTERLGLVTLELWVGSENIARARGVADQPLLYGNNGPIQVLSYFSDEGAPTMAAFLLLPSGETHMFRVTPQQRIVKASKNWQCSPGEWRAP